jgi:hypothetical protein
MKQNWLFSSLGVVCLAGTLSAQPKPTMQSVSIFTVAPDKVAAFVEKAKAWNPALEALMAKSVVLSYGVDVDILHSPDGGNVAFWAEVADYAGYSAMSDAMDAFEAANPAALNSLTELTDMKSHRDLIIRSTVHNRGSVPAGKQPYEDTVIVEVKPDRMSEFTELFKKYDVPVLDRLISQGVIYAYELDVEAVHTMKPGRVWIIYTMPELGSIDKVRAAFNEDVKKLPEAEQKMLDRIEDEMTVMSGHRDSLAQSVVYRVK